MIIVANFSPFQPSLPTCRVKLMPVSCPIKPRPTADVSVCPCYHITACPHFHSSPLFYSFSLSLTVLWSSVDHFIRVLQLEALLKAVLHVFSTQAVWPTPLIHLTSKPVKSNSAHTGWHMLLQADMRLVRIFKASKASDKAILGNSEWNGTILNGPSQKSIIWS